MEPVPVSTVPDAIRRIADSSDRQLAWQFFVFFSRFEYALKRNANYLKVGRNDAQADWQRFASRHEGKFNPSATSSLAAAFEYFMVSPPRKQLQEDKALTWSEPIAHDGEEPVLRWLLGVVCVVRNNLFHGGKFPMRPISDPSRDRDLMAHAIAVLAVCLEFDRAVHSSFFEGIEH